MALWLTGRADAACRDGELADLRSNVAWVGAQASMPAAQIDSLARDLSDRFALCAREELDHTERAKLVLESARARALGAAAFQVARQPADAVASYSAAAATLRPIARDQRVDAQVLRDALRLQTVFQSQIAQLSASPSP